MFKKIFISLLASLMIFVCTISIIRLANGKKPFLSLVTLSNVVSSYDPPHMLEYCLTTNFNKSFINFLNVSLSANPNNKFASPLLSFVKDFFSFDENYIDEDISFWKSIQSGLDWTDFITVPFAIFYDIGYNIVFVVSSFNSFITID